ncbi:MAG: helix-turn-helix transcriptional regulator [Isosphaeraceae bacterium]
MRRTTIEAVKTDLGQRVAELRREGGLTQARLAESAEISLRYLQSIEAGEENPVLDLLVRFANLFGVSVPDLFQPPRSTGQRKPGRPPARRRD